jgi:type III secretion protein L
VGASILKAKRIDGPRSGTTIKRDVHSALQQAREIVDDAHRKADRLINEAQQKAAAALETARGEGYAAGLMQWNEILAQAGRAYNDAISQSEPQLVRLAVRIAEKLIGEELRLDPDTIVKIVRETLKSARRERSVVVEVNPTHEALLRSQIEALRSSLGDVQEIRIVPNPAVPVGGCVVEGETGIIDAELETQLTCIEQALLRNPR